MDRRRRIDPAIAFEGVHGYVNRVFAVYTLMNISVSVEYLKEGRYADFKPHSIQIRGRKIRNFNRCPRLLGLVEAVINNKEYEVI